MCDIPFPDASSFLTLSSQSFVKQVKRFPALSRAVCELQVSMSTPEMTPTHGQTRQITSKMYP